MQPQVSVPDHLRPALQKAYEIVDAYFAHPHFEPENGRIEVAGERYVWVRAASLSVEFFDVVRGLYRDEGDKKAFAIAHGLLFDVAHALGRADARAFHQRFGLADPLEKLSTGPAHFARAGWASVEFLEEKLDASDGDTLLIYDHHHSFEADAWLDARGEAVDLPVCTMSAGYSSGWVSESVGTHLVSSEILCRARGDHCCRFVMAPPDRIEERIESYLHREPQVAERISEYRVPGFFLRKRIEDELREREAQYRGVFEASTDALLVATPDGRIIGANQAAEQLFDKRRDELDRLTVDALLPLRSDFATVDKIVAAGDVFHSELKLDNGDGEPCHIEVRGSSYKVNQRHHVLLSVRDITRQKQMQEQLYRADRLASLGTMAAGVAHEINNPLSFIISNLEVILWDLDNDDEPDLNDVRDAIGRAKRGAERVERTVRDLTNFSHGGLDDSVEPVDVHRMLDLAAQMVQKTIQHKGGQLLKHYSTTPPVLANEARLNQVFVNLLLNAAQALPEGAHETNLVEVATRTDAQKRVVVSVRDTGEGIPPQIRHRIFDPFFTTKPVDEGTGIGLAICHEIVQAIGGEISFETTVGEGTTFEVILPTQAQFSAPVGVIE